MTTRYYCPNEPVNRLSMAAFMHRLGTALTPEKVLVQEAPGALIVPVDPPAPRFCATADFPPATYPRTAMVNATISGLADGSAVAWRGFLEYSTDGGATWQATPTQTATRSHAAAGQWSNAAPVTAFPMAPGLAYRFRRDCGATISSREPRATSRTASVSSMPLSSIAMARGFPIRRGRGRPFGKNEPKWSRGTPGMRVAKLMPKPLFRHLNVLPSMHFGVRTKT